MCCPSHPALIESLASHAPALRDAAACISSVADSSQYIEELGSERALDPAKILEVVNANLGSVIRPIRIPGDVDAGKAGKEADQSGAAAKSDADETMALDGPDGEGDEEEAEDEESFVLDGRGGGPAGDAIDQPELDEAVERDES